MNQKFLEGRGRRQENREEKREAGEREIENGRMRVGNERDTEELRDISAIKICLHQEKILRY